MSTPILPNMAYKSGAGARLIKSIKNGRYGKYALQLPALWRCRVTFADLTAAAATQTLQLNDLKTDGDTLPLEITKLWQAIYVENAFVIGVSGVEADFGINNDVDGMVDGAAIETADTWRDTPVTAAVLRGPIVRDDGFGPTLRVYTTGALENVNIATAGSLYAVIAYVKLPGDGV